VIGRFEDDPRERGGMAILDNQRKQLGAQSHRM
jgi:hypothetical protein